MHTLSNHEKLLKIAALCGILGALIMAAGMLITGLGYTGIEGQPYSPINHFVSELGEIGVSNLAWVFNIGLILGGILLTLFIIGFTFQINHWLRYPLAAISIIATVSAALVGVFPMNNLHMHIRVAMTFFNLGMLISFLYSLVFLFNRSHHFSKWLALPGFINAALFTWFLNFPSEPDAAPDFQQGMQGLLQNRPAFLPMALLEWAVVLGILVWMLTLALYLNKNYRYVSNRD